MKTTLLLKAPSILLVIFISICSPLHAQYMLKVHFLYGSTPVKKYADEPKWFGGKLGGHVGVELEGRERILNFVPSGGYHVFQNKKDKHSEFMYHQYERFYSILGGEADSNKKTIVYIPITERQKQRFDSLSLAYVKETPYDYAFFGMRCGAAAYDVLAQLGILKQYTYYNTHTRIFYPKKLRKRLLKLAEENNWKIEKFSGSKTRNWETD